MNTAALEFESGTQWVLFALDAGRAAEYTPLPPAPLDAVLGVIDVAGSAFRRRC